MALHIEVRAPQVGCGLTPLGEPVVTGIDQGTGVVVSIVFNEEAWRAFLKNAPRLKGIGVHQGGLVSLGDGPGGAGGLKLI